MQSTTSIQADPQDTVYKNRYLILAIVLTGILMAVLDGYMVSIALPTITAHYNVSVALSQWTITGYLVVMTGLFIVFGKISEYVGKAKLFMAGWALFTASSLACGLAPGMNELIVFRICQAIGASMVAGVSGAIIFQAFPRKELGSALGYYGATLALGSLLGPGLSGFIVDIAGWQYIFLVNVPIGVVLLACSLKYLNIPETTSNELNIDWIGAAMLILSVASLMMFCGELAKNRVVMVPLIAYGLIFVSSLMAFVYQESRFKNPLLDLTVFGEKKFSLPVVSTLLFSVALNISIVIGPFYFQGVMGFTPSQVGLLSMVVPLVMMFASPTGGKLYDRHHWKFAAGMGVLVSAAAFLLLGYAFMAMNIGLAVVAFVLWGIGSGLFTSPNSAETMNALPIEKTAIASSVSTTARSLGGALGVSIASIFLTTSLNSPHQGTASVIGLAVIAAGTLCLLSAVTSLLRNI